MANQFNLLATRRFLPLFITQFLGTFNGNSFKNALAILIIYRGTTSIGINPQILVTFAAGIFILPFFLFSATAGELADKYPKPRLIVLIKFAEIILMLTATMGFYLNNTALLLLVLFLLGAQSAFFGPLKYAILPEQLRDNELLAGNGLIEAGTFIAILIGTIIGGILILYPHGDGFISIIICSAALAGLLSSLFIPKSTATHAQLAIHYNFIRETWRIIQYSKQRRDIFLCILGISWFWLIGSTFLAEFPVFTKNDLHSNQHVVTFFFALFSTGIALGSLLCNKLLRGKVHANYVPLGALGMTLFTMDLFFATTHIPILMNSELTNLQRFLSSFNGWRITFDVLLIAICGGLYTVPLYTILQQRSEQAHRARVIACNNVMNALFMVLAAVVTMFMLKIGLTVNQVFLWIAIGNGIVTVYICKLLPAATIRHLLRSIANFYKN